VLAGQTTGVVLTLLGIVGPDVPLVALGQLGHRLLDVPDATILAHRLRGHVGVGTSAVPVAGHRLGIQSGHNLWVGELFSHKLCIENYQEIIANLRQTPRRCGARGNGPSRGHHQWRFPRRVPPGTPTGRASPRHWFRTP